MWGKVVGKIIYICSRVNSTCKSMKVTFIIKKAAKRYDTESMATIYVRFRNGRRLDSVAPTQLAINPNLWDDKDECVKNEKTVCK